MLQLLKYYTKCTVTKSEHVIKFFRH